MIESTTIALSALKTFYSGNKDVISLYGDVILKSIGGEKRSLDAIQKIVLDEFQIEIPIDMIKTVIKRLKTEKHVIWANKYSDVIVSQEGAIKQSELNEDIKIIERKENALLLALQKNYLPNESLENLSEYLKLFIKNNRYVAANILLGEKINSPLFNERIEESIRQFFHDTEKNNPDFFDYLKDILFGQIVASAFLNKSIDFSLKEITVYVDTNIFLSLLELHDESINKSVRDAIDLILENGASIKIFQHIKEEVIQLLQRYLSVEQMYSKDIPVNSIYYTMKKKGYDAHDVRNLITDIDKKLSSFNITVLYEKRTQPIPPREYYQKLIAKKEQKENTHPISINNDCLSLELIRKIRGNKADSCQYLHKSKAIFLSSDKILVKFSKEKHREIIPEAFTPEQMTGILWLHDIEASPNTFIHDFLSRNITNQMVDVKIWFLFVDKLRETKKNNNLSDNQIDRLLADENTKAVLLEGDENEINSLIDDFNIKKIQDEDASKNKELVDLKKGLEKKDGILANQREELAENIHALTKLNERIRGNCQEKIDKSILVKKRCAVFIFVVLFIIAATLYLLDAQPLANLIIQFLFSSIPIALVAYFWKEANRKRNTKIDKCILKEKQKLGLSE